MTAEKYFCSLRGVKKQLPLSCAFVPFKNLKAARATEAEETITPGDISGHDGSRAFSCSWNWDVYVSDDTTGTMSVGADDMATLSFAGTSLSVPDTFGPQGGSQYTEKSTEITLSPGYYQATLTYSNIGYNPPEGNVASLTYTLPGGTEGKVVPGNERRFAYDLHGNVVAEFGSGTQPAVFEFDDADNKISQKFFRAGSEVIDGAPRERGDFDETLWVYHEAT
ncbi:MAG: hypothetical protein LUD39_03095, partial [Opitutae bacterium]|nr:hypothetical protein [Opitutae bacterium]